MKLSYIGLPPLTKEAVNQTNSRFSHYSGNTQVDIHYVYHESYPAKLWYDYLKGEKALTKEVELELLPYILSDENE